MTTNPTPQEDKAMTTETTEREDKLVAALREIIATEASAQHHPRGKKIAKSHALYNAKCVLRELGYGN